MEVAPVILFIYKRPQHTQKVLEALHQNEMAGITELYIYCDGAKTDADEATLHAIKQARVVAKSELWCKTVHIIERKENLGLEASVITGVTEVINKHGKAIVLEDDVVPTPYFLKYMNEALTLYENEPKAFSIGAFNFFATDDEVPDTFFVPIPDCWGWATWKDRWTLFEPNAQLLLDKLRDKCLINSFNLNGAFDFESMLIDQVKGDISSWAIRWQAVAYLENKLTLYPKFSVTKNIGFNAGATHGGEDRFSKYVRFAKKPIAVKKIEVLSKSSIIEKMENGYFRTTQPTRVFRIRASIKKNIKQLIPPAITLLYRKIRPHPITNNLHWEGDYLTWADAKGEWGGYEAPEILEKTKNAILKVKNGLVSGERDSVLFDRVQYNWPVITYLLKFAIENNNLLNIIDFGGSFGTSYFQNRSLIPQNVKLSWNIVEQESYIEVGNNEIADEHLSFFYSIEDAFKYTNAEILLLSSVLQYLEKPYVFLDEVLKYGFRYIIIDRTSFIENTEDRLTRQIVPASIYKASYPSWFFSISKFKKYFSNEYSTLLEFDSDIVGKVNLEDQTPAMWKGYILKKR